MMFRPDAVRRRILIVDDDLSNRRLMVKALTREGYECTAAASVVEAKGLLEGNSYSVLITDMRMWGEDGLELVRFTTDEYPDMAAIMVSGLADSDLASKSRQAGASAFLQKPMDIEELLKEVEIAVDSRDEAIKLRKHREW